MPSVLPPKQILNVCLSTPPPCMCVNVCLSAFAHVCHSWLLLALPGPLGTLEVILRCAALLTNSCMMCSAPSLSRSLMFPPPLLCLRSLIFKWPKIKLALHSTRVLVFCLEDSLPFRTQPRCYVYIGNLTHILVGLQLCMACNCMILSYMDICFSHAMYDPQEQWSSVSTSIGHRTV